MNTVSLHQINNKGSFITHSKYLSNLCNKIKTAICRPVANVEKLAINELPASNIRAYANIIDPNSFKYKREMFGYSIENLSKPLGYYRGTKQKELGLSTVGETKGGTWIKANINIPLSTPAPHDCAVMHLINDARQEHLLFHVYKGVDYEKCKGTHVEDIIAFINKNFSEFDEVNILIGDLFDSKVATENIATAVKQTNPKAKMNFYHLSKKEPEIVAFKRKLNYFNKLLPGEVSFRQTGNFFYNIGTEFTL